jgi:hypothetical protein
VHTGAADLYGGISFNNVRFKPVGAGDILKAMFLKGIYEKGLQGSRFCFKADKWSERSGANRSLCIRQQTSTDDP